MPRHVVRIDHARAVSVRRSLEADRALEDKTKAFVASLRANLLASFAGNLDTLAKFGLTPRQKPFATPDAKVAAAAKAKATRAAASYDGSEAEGDGQGDGPFDRVNGPASARRHARRHAAAASTGIAARSAFQKLVTVCQRSTG